MINLLPYEEKKEVEREGLRRFVIVAVFFISAVLLTCILLMSPIYLLLYQEKVILRSEENLLKKGSKAERITEITNEVRKINSELAVIESSSKNTSISETLKKVLESTPNGISINDISFARQKASEQGNISLRGKASTRESLLVLLKILNDLGLFSKVDSPVSNILKKNDIDFTINLGIK